MLPFFRRKSMDPERSNGGDHLSGIDPQTQKFALAVLVLAQRSLKDAGESLNQTGVVELPPVEDPDLRTEASSLQSIWANMTEGAEWYRTAGIALRQIEDPGKRVEGAWTVLTMDLLLGAMKQSGEMPPIIGPLETKHHLPFVFGAIIGSILQTQLEQEGFGLTNECLVLAVADVAFPFQTEVQKAESVRRGMSLLSQVMKHVDDFPTIKQWFDRLEKLVTAYVVVAHGQSAQVEADLQQLRPMFGQMMRSLYESLS